MPATPSSARPLNGSAAASPPRDALSDTTKIISDAGRSTAEAHNPRHISEEAPEKSNPPDSSSGYKACSGK